MDVERNAAFAEALDSATEEAVAEYDAAEEESFESEEALSQEEPVEPEQDFEDEIEADEIEADESEDAEDAVEEQVVEWDGNPDNIPPALVKAYKDMQAGFTKKMQEIAERDRQRDELHRQTLAELQAQQKQKAIAADPRPTNPTEDMTYEQQQARWDEISQWNGREALRQAVERGEIPDPSRVEKQTQEFEQANKRTQIMSMLSAQEGWTDESWSEMQAAASGDPFWESQAFEPQVMLALFNHVKQQKSVAELQRKAAELEANKVKRKASASKRATPKPTTQTKAAAQSPAERFKDMGFDEKLEAVIAEEFGI